MIRAVLWDLGGVLCHFEPARRIAALCDLTGRPATAIDAALTDELMTGLDRGEIDGAGLVAALEWRATYEELGVAWCAAFAPNRDVLALAKQLD